MILQIFLFVASPALIPLQYKIRVHLFLHILNNQICLLTSRVNNLFDLCIFALKYEMEQIYVFMYFHFSIIYKKHWPII